MKEKYYAQDISQIEKELHTSLDNGLSDDEAKKRLASEGPNSLASKKKRSMFMRFIDQFKDFMIIVLIVAAVLSGVVANEWTDAAIIMIVVLLNAILGVIQEARSEAAIDALKEMSTPNAHVRRGGAILEIPSTDIVPGDVVLLEAGDVVPADMRLAKTASLKVEESALTGESVPVEKDSDILKADDVALGDRVNMAYANTNVTYGRAEGIVVGTGMKTEVGKIATMLNNADETATPLKENLNQLGKTLTIMILAICVIVFVVGMFTKQGSEPTNKLIIDMFLVAVSLAVAAIPEGLPAIVTIILALGTQTMAKHRAIVRKLPAVDHYGDKFFVAVKGAPDELLKRVTKIEKKDQVTPISDSEKENILASNKNMAEQALRVLGLAYKVVDKAYDDPTTNNVEQDLIFAGLVGMIDPERPEAKAAVAEAKSAGIRTVMITGDHQITAAAIASRLGILEEGSDKDKAVITGAELDNLSDDYFNKHVQDYSVYARVSPENKVRIVKAWQANNKIVAMTGDGVNDAPSLKQADIGIGMGITGTEVSKGAADMVLADDNFATIVEAIKQGRKVFANIQKAILYLMSCNVGEVLTVFMMTMLGWDILMPVQLLWINLVTDTLPAIALGVEPVEPGIMKKKPRGRKSNFFSGGVASSIIYQGILEGILVLGAYQFGLHVGPHVGNAAMQHADALTMAFLTLGLIQLFHAINSKFIHTSIFRGQTFENKWFNGAILISALVMAAVEIPFLTKIFDVTELDGMQWLVVIIAGLLMIIIVEIVKFFERRTARK